MLQPSYTLTLGAQQWTNQALALDVELGAAPFVDRIAVRFPFAAPVSAGTGDPVSLTLHNGEKEAAVFAGTVESLARTPSEICVRAANAAGALAGFRPAVTYESLTAGTLIRKLCDEAAVDVASVDDGVPLAFYVADGSRSAWDHIARVSAWSGALASVSADNAVQAPVVDASAAEVALRYGRELRTIRHAENARPIASFTVAGQSGAGDIGSADAFRPAVDFFAGSPPEGPSPTRRWRSEPALRTVAGAARAAAATQRLYTARGASGSFEAFLQPDLRPGTVLEIQDMPQGFPGGPLWLGAVRHRLSTAGAVTWARFYQGGDRFDPTALLGSLLSAVGGLL